MKIFQKIQVLAKTLKRDVMVLWFALKNPLTPMIAKVIAFLTVAYALSPIDLIPDFIPLLGYLDDFIVIPVLVAITLRLIPDNVMSQSRAQLDEWLRIRRAKPISRWGLMIVVSIWLMVIWLVVRAIVGEFA